MNGHEQEAHARWVQLGKNQSSGLKMIGPIQPSNQVKLLITEQNQMVQPSKDQFAPIRFITACLVIMNPLKNNAYLTPHANSSQSFMFLHQLQNFHLYHITHQAR